jgi:hypothetical protein
MYNHLEEIYIEQPQGFDGIHEIKGIFFAFYEIIKYFHAFKIFVLRDL